MLWTFLFLLSNLRRTCIEKGHRRDRGLQQISAMLKLFELKINRYYFSYILCVIINQMSRPRASAISAADAPTLACDVPCVHPLARAAGGWAETRRGGEGTRP